MIWKVQPTHELMKLFPNKSMGDHLGIEFTDFGADYISARMPVDHRTTQPFGLLHGGASCVLAETLGSVASTFCIDINKQLAVGLEINANHIKSARNGYVYGTARPVHIGRSTHVWDIRIENEEKQLVCVSRLTVAIKDQPAPINK